MLSDLDLWRAARIMVKRYGYGAANEAAMRAAEFLDQGRDRLSRRCGVLSRAVRAMLSDLERLAGEA